MGSARLAQACHQLHRLSLKSKDYGIYNAQEPIYGCLRYNTVGVIGIGPRLGTLGGPDIIMNVFWFQ